MIKYLCAFFIATSLPLLAMDDINFDVSETYCQATPTKMLSHEEENNVCSASPEISPKSRKLRGTFTRIFRRSYSKNFAQFIRQADVKINRINNDLEVKASAYNGFIFDSSGPKIVFAHFGNIYDKKPFLSQSSYGFNSSSQITSQHVFPDFFALINEQINIDDIRQEILQHYFFLYMEEEL